MTGHTKIEVFSKRFFIIFLVFLIQISSTFQFAQYSVISNIVKRFYNVNDYEINATAVIYFFVYLVGVVPANLLIDKLGMRTIMVITSCFLSLGCIIKYMTVHPGLFWMSFVGQLLGAVSELFLNCCPVYLTTMWFPSDEVKRATSFLMFATFTGLGLGYLIPPFVVANDPDPTVVAHQLRRLLFCQSAVNVCTYLLVVSFFDDKPLLPPSVSQAQAIDMRKNFSLRNSVVSLFANYNYMRLVISSGLTIGVYKALLTNINQLLLPTFPGAERWVAIIGMLMVFSGSVSSVFITAIVRSLGSMKTAYCIFNWCTFVSLIFLLLCIHVQLLEAILAVVSILGYSTTSIYNLAYMLSSELTYPEPEALSSGILVATNQITGTVLSFVAAAIVQYFGSSICLSAFQVLIAVCLFIDVFIKEDLRRTMVENQSSQLNFAKLTEDKINSPETPLL